MRKIFKPLSDEDSNLLLRLTTSRFYISHARDTGDKNIRLFPITLSLTDKKGKTVIGESFDEEKIFEVFKGIHSIYKGANKKVVIKINDFKNFIIERDKKDNIIFQIDFEDKSFVSNKYKLDILSYLADAMREGIAEYLYKLKYINWKSYLLKNILLRENKNLEKVIPNIILYPKTVLTSFVNQKGNKSAYFYIKTTTKEKRINDINNIKICLGFMGKDEKNKFKNKLEEMDFIELKGGTLIIKSDGKRVFPEEVYQKLKKCYNILISNEFDKDLVKEKMSLVSFYAGSFLQYNFDMFKAIEAEKLFLRIQKQLFEENNITITVKGKEKEKKKKESYIEEEEDINVFEGEEEVVMSPEDMDFF